MLRLRMRVFYCYNQPAMFRKVLVANRGEIACRVIRALREAKIPSVAVYSDVDRASLAVRMADEAVHLGPATSTESYLHIGRVLDAARKTGADAIHPGYGFLSENAEFAAACQEAGLVFIGPPASAIAKLGSKTAARQLALEAGVAVVPGAKQAVESFEQARAIASQIGYPVLLKAAAGGGGKGMRRVDQETELEAALRDAASEAERAFKSREVYIEKLVVKPRHVEIQVLGDLDGNLIHLGERECSIQRRHQKVVEESPSPLMLENPALRHAMGQAAVKLARAAGYYNAGTCEFLVDANHNFYFLEMNTRLQVEHPVTELVTGLDLVHWQLKIASGQRLSLRQEDIEWRGSAIECRIYAEDPSQNFFPSPGKILQLREPSGPGVRLDSGVYPGWTVPMEYDPLLAKLAVWAEDRPAAIARLQRAVDEYRIVGIQTNLSFFRALLADTEFLAGRLHTGFIEEFFARQSHPPLPDEVLQAGAYAALQHAARQRSTPGEAASAETSRWRAAGLQEIMR
ncbi:MAG: acetyl-CoA carboxylase biotin carboxylase subunit [Bryobacteraceae bacterium]|nr:acetyl-CoA carboxylase biotin carboxylase subunit [Bryobacteraceae bacterium]MDW8376806.1 acetyl-CoA carboxylase biotin carboxylase subunit [Bryobacterales bacterium]